MLVETLQDPIRVVVDFQANKVRPLAFLHAGRRHEVTQVNLVYRKRLGARYVWCFAVSDGENTYGLTYDPENLSWVLSEVQMEG